MNFEPSVNRPLGTDLTDSHTEACHTWTHCQGTVGSQYVTRFTVCCFIINKRVLYLLCPLINAAEDVRVLSFQQRIQGITLGLLP